MFDVFYPFQQVHRINKKKGELEITITKFSFLSSSNHRYIIEVEEYPFFLFAVKFYLKAHADSDNKYNLITGHEANTTHYILRTCVEVMVDIYKNNPYASFTFIGAPMIGEEKDTTKRFRVYKILMTRLFPRVTYTHLSYPEQSIYLMLNKDNKEEGLLGKIKGIIQAHFLLPDKEE